MAVLNFVRYELYTLSFLMPFGFWPELLITFSAATYIGLISTFLIFIFPSRFQLSPYLILPCIFIFFTLPSLLQGDGYIPILLSFVGYVLLIVLITSSFTRFRHIELFFRAYFYGLLALSFLIALALAGYADLGGYFSLPFVEDIWGIPRVLGTESNPNAFGVYYILGLTLSINYFFLSKSWSRKNIYLIACTSMLLVLFFTYSRSSMVAMLVSVIVYLYYKNSNKKRTELYRMFFLAAFLSLLGYLTYQSGSMSILPQGAESLIEDKATSSEYRIYLLYQTIDIFSDNVFFGVGFNQLTAETMLRGLHLNQTAHNTLLAIAVEYGVFALVAYIVFLVVLTLRFASVVKRQVDDRIRGSYSVILGVFAGFFVNGLVHEGYVNVLMWVIIALMVLILTKEGRLKFLD